MYMKVAVVVPTFNPDSNWSQWISALLRSGVDPRDVYIIDSGSEDNSVQLSIDAEFNVQKINKKTFNHGGTRQQVVDGLNNYEVVVFLTQDAILSSVTSINSLLSAFDSPKIGAVCGRQLPRHGAGYIEAHARLFNYTKKSTINTFDDVNNKGLKSIFLSNSFAAYRVSALKSIGGFPDNVIFGEDMYVAAKMLLNNYNVAYASDACVYHSHDYSITQEIKRYFDMGVFHAHAPWIRKEFGSAENEGIKFVLSEFKYLLNHAFWKIPEGILRTLCRYGGFRLGLLEQKLSLKVKKLLTMNKGYFK